MVIALVNMAVTSDSIGEESMFILSKIELKDIIL